ncbi:hypothetical protein [Dactylosporangium sp. CA-139066]|uniref:hypothetical protein n=1 Tax=Dactylosporangium sp. CA-139066 TaxID=3239930 RepID=UPI003D94951B
MEPWWWPIACFACAGAAMLALSVYAIRRFRSVRAGAGRPGRYAAGQPAEASVMWVAYRQEAFRGDPVVGVTVRLAPADGSEPFTATRDLFVSDLAVPWFGEPMAAWYDPADPGRFVLTTRIDAGTPPSLRELHEQLRSRPASPAPHPCDAVGVLARIGRLDEDLAAGRLTREAHFEQRNDLYNAAFP